MQGGDRPSAFGNSRVGRIDGWSPVLRHHRIPLTDRLPVTLNLGWDPQARRRGILMCIANAD